ncbi:MAG: acyltransferase [Candidatus Margulisbacteria bacterium]|nr:acyltransferase [Candidatus Margulisiibacteriota bacterium]
MKSVEIEKKCRFWGVPIIYRRPNSKIKIGYNCRFRSDKRSNLIGINRRCIISTLKKGSIIRIGNNCGFSGTTISSAKSIRIGNNILCGANVIITDTDWHPLNPHNRNHKEANSKPIIIKNNAFIGVNCTILKGVTIGKNSVIGANSVVTKDIPDNAIAAGNPCKIIHHINNK